MEYSYSTELETSLKPQSHVTTEWLRDVLLVKLCRWAELENLKTEVTSLKLVPVDKYAVKYQELKHKYGTQLVKVSIIVEFNVYIVIAVVPHKFV